MDRVWRETLPANVSGNTAWETYEYDRNAGGGACAGRGLVTKITHADGKWQSSGYSQFGNKIWEENELRQHTSYAYDNYNRVLSTTNPVYKTEYFAYLKLGTSSAYLYTTNSGYTHTSGAGIATTNVYDPNWRKTSTTVAGALTSFAYDNVGNLTWVTDPLTHKTYNTYDNRNRKTSATEAWGSNVAATTVWHYDGASNINRIDRPDGTTETKGIDALNRVVWTVVPQSATVSLPTWFGYNPSGTVQWVKDGNLHVTTFAYDASDQKTKMTYPDQSYQSWAYDDAHNLKSRTTVSGKTQNFTYDNRNRKTQMTWSNSVDSASYGYDDAARLTSATNPNSTVTCTYYADGRLEHDYQAVVGLGTRSANYVYDGDGNVTWMNVSPFDNPSYNWTFSYDGMGRFEKIFVYGAANPSFQYSYDGASNVTNRSAKLPNSVTVDQYTPRDSLNRMSGRWLYKNGTPFAPQGYIYDRMNRLTKLVWGGVSDLYGYYWNGELYWCEYGVQTDSPFQEGQDPDLDTTDSVDPLADYQPPDTVEAEPTPPPDGTSDPPPTQLQQPDTMQFQRWVGYYLDKAGNRIVVGDSVNGNTTYAPNPLNQYTGSAGGGAVTNGNEHEISNYKGVTYSYINDEHLKQVTSGSNTYNLYYDALGRCVKRTFNSVTTYYIYDGEKPVLEYKSTDQAHPARNLYGKGIDEILMRTDPTVNSGQPFYYGQDHEGSVTQLIDGTPSNVGNVIETYQYDAFGATTKMWDRNGALIDHTALNNRFLFTGREYAATYQKTYVPAFTFYEYRARAYNPGLGRFMSEDPKLFVRRAGLGASPADWTFAAHPDEAEFNLFRYCGNDPIDFADPMGSDAILLVQPDAPAGTGFGHVAIVVGNDKSGWHFFEKQGGPAGNHNNRYLQFKNLQAFQNSKLGNNYQNAWRASSDAKQDTAMAKNGAANYNKAYYVKQENCADLAHDVLAAGDMGISKQKIFGITVPNILAQRFVADRNARDARADVRAPDASRADEAAQKQVHLQHIDLPAGPGERLLRFKALRSNGGECDRVRGQSTNLDRPAGCGFKSELWHERGALFLLVPNKVVRRNDPGVRGCDTAFYALQRGILFAFDIRLRQRRGDFDLRNLAVRLAASLEFHLLPGIGARAEKQDPRDLAVNIDLVKALIEIVRCSCCRLPVVCYFLRS